MWKIKKFLEVGSFKKTIQAVIALTLNLHFGGKISFDE
jgi:hypothetical protein